jgi:2-polyprenyl-3-methyl-5-hydroxy-6-metoxy-1,4-benzoquinol methylase
MQEIKTCPVCQSNQWKYVFDVTDHGITKESFSLIKCESCSLLVTSPRPANEKLSLYYQSEDYISHSGKSTNFLNLIYLLVRKISLRWKLSIITKIIPTGKLLDIGCGTGEFLNTIKSAGWEVSGVEPSETARRKAEELLQHSLLENLETATGQFEIITLWHVLEHLPDLKGSLEKIFNLLNSDGRVLIAVPNHNSADSKKYGAFWAGYDVPRHLWHFNQKAMATLLQASNFKLEKTIPMKLDSFYVSMLSEKYMNGGKNGIRNILKGLKNGLLSNLKSIRSGEYSSLIYIARK